MSVASAVVIVLGPGAVGCLVAAELRRAGRSVTLLDHRVDRARRLTAQGIIVEHQGRVTHVGVPVTTDARVVSSADLVLVTVKSWATRKAADALAGRLPTGALVVTLQNGLGNAELLRDALPGAAVVQALVYFGSRLVGEGHVVATPAQRMIVGGADSGALRRLEALFAPSAIRLESTDAIERELWVKTLVNAVINPLTALYGLRNGELPEHPEAWRQAEAVLREGVAVAAAEGHLFALAEVGRTVADTCCATAGNRSSMRQDVEAGRPTEIEAINGALVRLGAEKGIPTPHNAALVRRIRNLTRSNQPER